MRNQCRLLLLRSVTRSSFQTSSSPNLQLHKVNRSFSYLSSLITRNVNQNPSHSDFQTLRFRSFCSEPASEQPNQLDNTALTHILSKSSTNDQIKTGLESINYAITHEMVLNILENLQGNPEIAGKFFNFVSETEDKILSSKSYNLMLAILGRKDHVKQFWGLMDIMRKKGYGVSKRTYYKVLESFEKDEMTTDLGKFNEMYASKPDDNSTERVCARVCKVISENDWDQGTQSKLEELNCNWSNDLVAIAIEQLKVQPTKALMFFWWVEESSSFKHDKLTYTAMLKVLSREDSIEKFWVIVNEMKEGGYQMDMETYEYVMERFYKRRMVKDAVDLFEFMIGGEIKPSTRDAFFLLRKIVVNKDFDVELFSRAAKLFAEAGYCLGTSTFDSLVKALISVGRLQQCGRILKAMMNCGFVPTNDVYERTIFHLSSVGISNEATHIIDKMEASGCNPDFKTWTSLIHGQCVARDVEKAASSFRSMVEKTGVKDAGYAFDLIMKGFCEKKKAGDACKFLSEMVNGTELRPLHKTYKFLVVKLLARGNLNEALNIIRLMKGSDYPPYLDPFIAHISKYGTGTDAMRFLRAVTDKRFPSPSVFLSMFEAFFKAGRHSEAQNFLSECPSSIRGHADILNLFLAQKPARAVASTMTPVDANASTIAA